MSSTTLILIIVSVGFFILISVLLAIYFAKGGDKAWKKDVEKKLQEYKALLNTKDAVILQSAIVNLDKLLDHVMQKRLVKGETMGDRLKSAQSLFDKALYNQIWEAHKMRNQIVHEINVNTPHEDVRFHFYNLEKAIRKLLS